MIEKGKVNKANYVYLEHKYLLFLQKNLLKTEQHPY